MKTFRYLAPGGEEQRAFAMQFLGVLLGLLVAIGLSFLTRDTFAKMVLWGAVAGTIYLLARAAWQLEQKARRAQYQSIGIDDKALHLLDARSAARRIAWSEITDCEVRGGKLRVAWRDGEWEAGAREIEQGMELIREIVQRAKPENATAPANFIPLSPR